MNSYVDDKRCDPREGFATFIAFVRFLSCVNIVMFNEVLLLPEYCPTFITLIGLLSNVNLLMLGEVGLATEGFPALLANKGLLSRVTSLVPDET